MEKNNIERLFRLCSLLKVECIKKEIEDYLKSYTVVDNDNNSIFEFTLKNEYGDEILVSFKSNYLSLTKTTKTSVEKTTIYNNLTMKQRTLEKRENGIVITDVLKEYGISTRFNNKKIVLVDLYENRYVFTRETIEIIFKNVNFDTTSPLKLLLKTRKLESHDNLSGYCDFASNFDAHMNYYANWDNLRKVTNNVYPTNTYLNDTEVSQLYDLVDGEDKLYRVYNLYRGIINPGNEYDIYSIYLGLLSPECFNLRSLKGITEKEDSLVGPSLEPTEEYSNYLQQLFASRYGYTGEIKLDRESILKAINYKESPLGKTTKNPFAGPRRILTQIFGKK